MQIVKIKKITKIKQEDRYDLTVSSTGNFFANGILIHNTSFVVGNLLTYKEESFWTKFFKSIFGKYKKEKVYDILWSSRKVLKSENIGSAKHYYDTDIWGVVKEELKDVIPQGYTLYGEILGNTPSGSAIQGKYDYSCKPNEHKTYIYRITSTNPDGFKIELTDKQIEEFCEKYGLNYKDTFLYYGQAKDLYPELSVNEHWHENFLKNLERDYTEKDCFMCANKVPEEGIVLRKENFFDYEAYKLKSFRFLDYEDKQLEENVENLEDNQ